MRIQSQFEQHGIRRTAEEAPMESPEVSQVGRGFVFQATDEDTARKLASGSASVSDFIQAISKDFGSTTVGMWWGLYSNTSRGEYCMDFRDFQDFATGGGSEFYSVDGALAEVDAGEETYYSSEVRVILVGQRPQIDGKPWNPGANDFINGELMGNSFLPEGTSVTVTEIHYCTGSYAGPNIWRVASGSGQVTA